MKKIIALCLMLLVLLPGCNKEEDTLKEISKEEALEIYNKVNDSIDTYYNEIKSGDKSYYFRFSSKRYENGINWFSKTEMSLDNSTNEMIDITYGGIYELELMYGHYTVFNKEDEISKAYSFLDKVCYESNGLELTQGSALWEWNLSVDQGALRYKNNANEYSKINLCFEKKDTKYYSSKEGELYIVYTYDKTKYDYYFENYLPVRLSKYSYHKDGFNYQEFYFEEEACINLPDLNGFEIIKR